MVLLSDMLVTGSFSPRTSMGRDNLFMVPPEHLSSYLNMYPLKSKMEFGMSSTKGGESGWGATVLNDRLEEDVGRLLAELRLGTTAVDMN